ncbi:MAG: type II secretion system GspH family protein [Pirellulales bacterium]|nr:type II secretion system GspH family protein [Pirellulales bacterium]
MTRSYTKHSGFSLMEIIIALTILGLSLAAIGNLVMTGARSAQRAQIETTAQFLCESKLGEIKSGAHPPESVGPVPFEQYEAPLGWQYTVSAQPVDDTGTLLNIIVLVEQISTDGSEPIRFQLTTWMIDPAIELSPDSNKTVTELLQELES